MLQLPRARYEQIFAPPARERLAALAEVIGDFSEGKEFDAICLRPPAGTALDIGLRHAGSPDEALGKVFALASDADVADVWVGGVQIASGGFLRALSFRRPGSRGTPAG